jgi:hypothetical protein
MSKRVKVHVGTVKDMGQRFVSAWHRLERGEKVRERRLFQIYLRCSTR